MMQTPGSFNDTQFDVEVAEQVNSDITREIYKAGKIPDFPFVRKAVKKLLNSSISAFSRFIARVDALIGDFGFCYASKLAIQELAGAALAMDAEVIPKKGPLIIASNHPGTYDGFVLISNLPRDDFKIMVSGIPFFRNLPHASRYLIYSTRNTTDRMEAIRCSIRHLKEGGALVIYPSGRIDPDPSVLSGAELSLSHWSRSIEIFLRKVPEAELVLAITSGVLSREFANHPYTWLFKNDHERRRVMEFMQVIKQMVRGKPVDIKPAISFKKFICSRSINQVEQDVLRNEIRKQAGQLLDAHINTFQSK